LPEELTIDLDNQISLLGSRYLPRAYEAGNIVARPYEVESLPDESDLLEDLSRFLDIYRESIAIRNEILVSQPGRIQTRTQRTSPIPAADTRPAIFRPKNSSDYLAHVTEQVQRRSRKHEDLVRLFGQHLQNSGLTVATNVHPRDMVVRSGRTEVLIEAKVVGSNAEHAVREAVGQLLSYRHFYYRLQALSDPGMVALFSANIGEALSGLLASLDIKAAWYENGQWIGWPVDA
jgi:MrcB-like, N-terminal domain